MQANRYPHKLAVLGYPIKHSLSPLIHQHFAKQCGILIDYQAIEVAPFDFERVVVDFFNQGGVGLNVTLPFKARAFLMADEASQLASLSQVANTLWLKNNKIQATNTDVAGFIFDLERLNLSVEGKHILLLGAGGVSRAVLLALAYWHQLGKSKQSVQSVTIANRSFKRAQQLIKEVKNQIKPNFPIHCLQWQDISRLSQIDTPIDVILNATSLSLTHQSPPIEPKIFKSCNWCYDLAYLKDGNQIVPTAFELLAQKNQCSQTASAIGMLVEQASLSFNTWFEKRPQTEPVIQALIH